MLDIKEELIDCPDSSLDLWLAALHQYTEDAFKELKGLETGYVCSLFFRAAGYAPNTSGEILGLPDKKDGRNSFWRIERVYEHPRYHSDWQFQVTALDDLSRTGPQITHLSNMLGLDPEVVAPNLLKAIKKLVDEGSKLPVRSKVLLNDSASEKLIDFEWLNDF